VAVVVNPAAAPPEVAAEWEAVVAGSPAVAVARVVVAVDVRPVVEAAARVEAVVVVDAHLAAAVDKVVAEADARPAAVDKVVVDRVVVDKVVEEEGADARLVVVAADPPVVVEWEVEEAVVDVLPAVAGAAETVNSLFSSSGGASRISGAPLFS
jgi:hypothetical protein